MATRPKLRRRRRTKIIATLGPASALAGGADAAVPGRRRCVPAQLQPRHARRPRRPLRHDPSARGQLRPPDRHPRRRAGSEAARRHASPADACILQTGQPFQLDLNPTPGSASRVNLPHPEIIEAAAIGCSLLLDDGKLRLRVARKRRRRARDRGDGRRAAVRPQGRQRAGRGAADPGADRKGPRRSGLRAGARRQLHRPVVRAAAGGCGRGEGTDRRPRLDDGEAREAAGAG